MRTHELEDKVIELAGGMKITATIAVDYIPGRVSDYGECQYPQVWNARVVSMFIESPRTLTDLTLWDMTKIRERAFAIAENWADTEDGDRHYIDVTPDRAPTADELQDMRHRVP